MLNLICLKCGAKWNDEILERKQYYACLNCKEPGLRTMDDKGEAGEIWPKEGADGNL